ncbi:MAG: DUF4133 domain-containing protein [Candidatus Pseudobacter hemicellulosilyticus]|uniref:DUF4133 domain-containing protein n=1 Tax=Candidatus Pseudobacter hemicellulosilyticus TaxID=3121375 RepID=A0AAJ6BHB7_9BACT|nr:MAG: DUF4133 domain-containing protein [Pseudobacter sp.]
MAATSIYQINKGINKSIEFRGLKAQYIWYLGGVIMGLLLVFVILYLIGINQYVCVVVTGIIGVVGTVRIFALSKKYGEYGLMKAMARKMVPNCVRSIERSVFYKKDN